MEALELLASESEQLQYERNVPGIDITAELRSTWADDSYHPGDPFFRSLFSAAELDALAKFDAVYRANADSLPKSNGSVKGWLSSERWRRIMEAAKEARAKIAA